MVPFPKEKWYLLVYAFIVARVFEAWRLILFFFGSGRMLWRLIPFAILWSMWQERNVRIFKQTKEDVDQLVLVR